MKTSLLVLILGILGLSSCDIKGNDVLKFEWESETKFDFSKKKQVLKVLIPYQGGTFVFECTNALYFQFNTFDVEVDNFPNINTNFLKDTLFIENGLVAYFNDQLYGGNKLTIVFEENTSNQNRIINFGVVSVAGDGYTKFKFEQYSKQ